MVRAVAIYGWGVEYEAFDALVALLNAMQAKHWKVQIHSSLKNWLHNKFGYETHSIPPFADASGLWEDLELIVSVGGDGTFLDASAMVYGTDIPIVGVNFGHLGFLTSAGANDVHALVERLEARLFQVERRSTLRVNINSANEEHPERFALNDISLQKSGKSMLRVNAYVDGEFLCSYWCDGLIVSTPTGSTAYSISVGGPIMVPGASVMLICPIAPHNLSIRPLVLPDTHHLHLRAWGRDSTVMVGVDANVYPCQGPVEVEVTRAIYDVRVIRTAGDSFFAAIREKLNWGVDVRN